MWISAADARIAWPGSICVESDSARSVHPWRLPRDHPRLFPTPYQPGVLWRRAGQAAGVRMSFRTSSPSIRVHARFIDNGGAANFGSFDLVRDGRILATENLRDGRVEFRLDSGTDRDLEIWLPHFDEVEVLGVEIEDGHALQASTDVGRPRWLVYGSSLTQCQAAASPAQTWPAIVARTRGTDLTCLGFGGSALMEQAVARVIRDRPADAVSLELGINVYGRGAFGRASLQPAVIGFLLTVREGHPDAPVTVISPPASPSREDAPGPAGLTLAEVREQIAEATETINAEGYGIGYVDGRELLDVADASLLHDGLHPSAEGYHLMADRALKLGIGSLQ